MRFQFIDKHRDRWPIQVIDCVLQLATSGYYAGRDCPVSSQDERRRKMMKRIQVIYAELRGRYGSPRVHRELLAEGNSCSENFIAKLMRQAGLRAKTKRKFRQATDSRHNLADAPNSLSRNFTAEAPNRVWLPDITYILPEEAWLYLCTVEDFFSRRIVGWSLSARINTRLGVDAVETAVALRQPPTRLILHSDCGIQYYSDHFQRLLGKHGI